MRTGIYVYKSTTLVITASEDNLKLAIMDGQPDFKTLTKSTKVTLEPGVYRVLSTGPITVTGSDHEVVALAGDKDKWPDPPPKLTQAFSLISGDSLRVFFQAKGIEDP